MDASTKSRGDAAEAAAARLLLEQGYEVVARNIKAGGVELDLIARDASQSIPTYVFVEVRSRSDDRLGHPLETIDGRKRGRLVRGAKAWLVNAGLFEKVAVRFDIVAITRDFGEAGASPSLALRDDEVLWLKGAFEVDG